MVDLLATCAPQLYAGVFLAYVWDQTHELWDVWEKSEGSILSSNVQIPAAYKLCRELVGKYPLFLLFKHTGHSRQPWATCGIHSLFWYKPIVSRTLKPYPELHADQYTSPCTPHTCMILHVWAPNSILHVAHDPTNGHHCKDPDFSDLLLHTHF